MVTRSGRAPITSSRERTEQAPPGREDAVRTYLHRWVEAAGAQLLVVDPSAADGGLSAAMAGRGVHVTWVRSTIDALVEFGRLDPQAVVVAPETPGLPAAEFVAAVRRHGASYVVAALDLARAGGVGPLILAGASAVVARPYSAAHLWEVLSRAPGSLAEHARVVVGSVELDASAYSVRVDGERIADLPLKEFELLRVLMLRAPEVVPDDDLRTALWGTGAGRRSGNTIAMHVTRLRARLDGAVTIRRIRGRGYSLTTG